MRQVEIKVQGCLDSEWEEWFPGFEITYTLEDETVLVGEVTDQSALYGMLMKIRNLGLTLISLAPITPRVGEQ
jgi:hypothetical protein